ncbi:PaaI family thioesterase [Litorivivens sp.]|uniref:PaaI family thioesterase n=1 Tax=Litorivivens sp. TaxID=2020868 RepID=UPI003564779F
MSQKSAQDHYLALASMYKAAPINAYYLPEMVVSEGEAVIEIEACEKHFHSAGAVHGSVYFKMLDDAAFFAANSLEPEFFVLTTSFTTYLTRPASSGKLKSVGKVVNSNKSQFIAESVVYDEKGREIGRGNGIFMRSKMALADVPGYS